MDFLDFQDHKMYFDDELSNEQEEKLKRASELYPSKKAEKILLQLLKENPQALTLIVALYRYYYYKHNYYKSLELSSSALAIVSHKLGIKNDDWDTLSISDLDKYQHMPMGLIRFFMFALKAEAFLLLKVGSYFEAYNRLAKIVELDPRDAFGANFLLGVAYDALSKEEKQKISMH